MKRNKWVRTKNIEKSIKDMSSVIDFLYFFVIIMMKMWIWLEKITFSSDNGCAGAWRGDKSSDAILQSNLPSRNSSSLPIPLTPAGYGTINNLPLRPEPRHASCINFVPLLIEQLRDSLRRRCIWFEGAFWEDWWWNSFSSSNTFSYGQFEEIQIAPKSCLT